MAAANGLDPADLKITDVSATVFETTLSVEQCRSILRHSGVADSNFRKLREDVKLKVLVDAMRSGRWRWTDADPIRLHVDPDSGSIVATDGQHRLHAAVTARRVLRTLVLFGDDWKAGVHVDRNRVRNVAQYLEHDYGISSPAIYVALARFHMARVLSYATNRTSVNNTAHELADEEIIDFIVNHQEQIRSANSRAGTGGSRGFNNTAYGVFLYELGTISPETADQFHEDMKRTDLPPGDPLNQLRRVVMRRYQETGLRAHRDYSLSNLVKAHNMRVTGQEITRWPNAPLDEVVFPAGFKLPDIDR